MKNKVIEKALVPIQKCSRCKSRVKLSKWKVKLGKGFWTCPVCGEVERISFSFPEKTILKSNPFESYMDLTICKQSKSKECPPGTVKQQRDGTKHILICYFDDSKGQRECAKEIFRYGWGTVCIPYTWSIFQEILFCQLYEDGEWFYE